MAQATELTTIMSDEEAFGDLARQGVDGPVTTSARQLASRWGYPDNDAGRMRVTRRLKLWEERGLITRSPAPDGRQTITIGTVNNTVNNTLNVTVVQPVEAVIAGPSSAFIPPVHRPRVGVHQVGALMLGVLGLFAAGIAFMINVNFGHSLGRTPEAALLFSGLAAVADASGLMLPTAARALWRGGHWVTALVAWAVLAVVIMPMAWLAAVGFASVNISDTTAGRAKTASESATLAAQIERLTKEPAAISETRSVPAIEADIQAAQSQAPVVAVWNRTAGCKDVTQQKSGEACGPLLRLRQTLGEAQRREAIDAEFREKQAQLAALPAVSSADPQAEEAAKVITWLSRGFASPMASDFAMLRVTLLTALQLIPGILIMLAASVWGLRPARMS
jgi:hypothetical protein